VVLSAGLGPGLPHIEAFGLLHHHPRGPEYHHKQEIRRAAMEAACRIPSPSVKRVDVVIQAVDVDGLESHMAKNTR
jgi:hypothetical protein